MRTRRRAFSIIRHAALTGAMLEDFGRALAHGEPIDPGLFATLSNAERRLYEAVGISRRGAAMSRPTCNIPAPAGGGEMSLRPLALTDMQLKFFERAAAVAADRAA